MSRLRRSLRHLGGVAVVAVLALGLAACHGSSDPGPTPSPTLEASMAAFEQLSGLSVPTAASGTTVRVVADPSGAPAYRVDFTLPSSQVDRFCTDGGLQRPLDVYTVPVTVRERFDYDGQDPQGVKIAQGALPSSVDVQRSVLATGADTTTATVRVYAYRQPR